MHQQSTADKSSSSTSSILPGIAAFLFLVLLLRRVVTAIAALLAVSLLLAVASLLSVAALLLAITATVSALLSIALLTVTALLAVATLALVARARVVECAFAGLLVYKEPPVVAGIPLGVPRRGDWWGAVLLVLLLTAMLALARDSAYNTIEETHCEIVWRFGGVRRTGDRYIN